MSHMHIYTSGSAMENDPKQNLADKRFDKVDLQFQTVQTKFEEELFDFRESMRKDMFEFRESIRKDMSDFRESIHKDMSEFRESMHRDMSDFRDSMHRDMSDFRESMRKDMFKFAGFLTVSVLSAISIFGTFVR
jgi:DNA relaxase NicK